MKDQPRCASLCPDCVAEAKSEGEYTLLDLSGCICHHDKVSLAISEMVNQWMAEAVHSRDLANMNKHNERFAAILLAEARTLEKCYQELSRLRDQ